MVLKMLNFELPPTFAGVISFHVEVNHRISFKNHDRWRITVGTERAKQKEKKLVDESKEKPSKFFIELGSRSYQSSHIQSSWKQRWLDHQNLTFFVIILPCRLNFKSLKLIISKNSIAMTLVTNRFNVKRKILIRSALTKGFWLNNSSSKNACHSFRCLHRQMKRRIVMAKKANIDWEILVWIKK